ncbi:MAG: hypothetical protein PQ971_00645 [Methanobacterium sp.]
MPPKTEIPELLGDVSKELGGRWFKYRLKIAEKVIIPLMNAFLSFNSKIQGLMK